MTHGVKSRSKARSAAEQPIDNDELVFIQLNQFFTPLSFIKAKALLEKGHSVADVSEFFGAPELAVSAIKNGEWTTSAENHYDPHGMLVPEQLPPSAIRAIRRRIRDVERQLNKLKKIIKIAEDA